MITLALELADLLAQAVALRLQFFGTCLDRLALGLQRTKYLHIQERLWILARLQACDNTVEFLAQQVDI